MRNNLARRPRSFLRHRSRQVDALTRRWLRMKQSPADREPDRRYLYRAGDALRFARARSRARPQPTLKEETDHASLRLGRLLCGVSACALVLDALTTPAARRAPCQPSTCGRSATNRPLEATRDRETDGPSPLEARRHRRLRLRLRHPARNFGAGARRRRARPHGQALQRLLCSCERRPGRADRFRHASGNHHDRQRDHVDRHDQISAQHRLALAIRGRAEPDDRLAHGLPGYARAVAGLCRRHIGLEICSAITTIIRR